MQMTGDGKLMPGSESVEEQKTPEVSGVEHEAPAAEAEEPIAWPPHESPSHSHNSTSAEQEKARLAEPVPEADLSDIELQRRKAALLQQVKLLRA